MYPKVDSKTLIVIPCCAAKASGGANVAMKDPLATSLSDTAYAQLCLARRAVLAGIQDGPDLLTGAFTKNRALRDGPDLGGDAQFGRYLPALERYTGNLYAVPGLRAELYASIADDNAPRVLILSALYGPLHPLSPIQDYNLRMDQVPARIWRTAFLPVLDHYVRTHGIQSIILLVGSTTAYYRVANHAVSDLLRRGCIDQASQYHIHHGGTRTTPLEHGRLLHNMLCGRPSDSTRIERRDIHGARRSVPPVALANAPLDRETVAQAVANAPRLANVGEHRDRFYALMRRLMTGVDQGLSLARLLEIGHLPKRGVYFFIDPETPESGQWRICRVGTHAVSIGAKSTLRARLRAHLGTRSGGGNHRGSIFRLHVGNALLQRDQREITTWGVGSVAPPALRASEVLRQAESRHEQQVSEYIGQLPVLWLAVPDDASLSSERSIIERNAIALLSRSARCSAAPCSGWLGEHSPRREIRDSRLWNLNYVDDDYDPSFLALLERTVAYTLAK